MEESTTLDVLYAPIVKLERAKGNKLQRLKNEWKITWKKNYVKKKSFTHFSFLGGFEFEADIDNLQIRCLAEGNPPPNVFWRKAGGESILR